MPLQLQTFIDTNGNELKIGHRTFTVLGIGSDGDGPNNLAAATFKSVRASYNAVRCNNSRVFQHDGAEVWAILGPKGRTIAQFAVHEGKIIELT